MSTILRIEKLVFGGDGLARCDGQIHFVSDVLPGETVAAEIIGSKAKCLLARPVEILEPSPDRVTPFCPHAHTCGGCGWQHIRYERQASLKKEIFLDCLRRIGKIAAAPGVQVLTGPPTGYRHRAQIKVDVRARTAGFYKALSNDVVPIDSCPLLVPALDRFLHDLPAHSGDLPADTRQVKAVAGDDDTVAADPVVPGISQPATTVTCAGHRFKVGGTTFFQQNRPLLEALGTWGRDTLTGGNFLDLYGGGGFFSVLHGDRFGSGALVESDEDAAKLAAENLAANGMGLIAAKGDTTEQFLKGAIARNEAYNCVIVDPPRAGLTPAAREGITRLKPAMILYISCDPSTQARDAGYFLNTVGYGIRCAALFDLYPQTYHMETALLLERGK
jgi:23S rRNA (uracil1939-C5)-methyltransferase